MASATIKADTATETDPYAEREAKIAALRDKLRQREAETSAAEQAAQRVIGGLRSGNDTFTAADLAAAKVETERAGYLFAAAKSAYDRAVKAGPHRPIVADELTQKIADALGLPVATAPTLPGDDGNGRRGWLVQTAATQVEAGGGVSTEGIQLVVYRDDLHRPTDWEAVQNALGSRAMWAPVTVASRPSQALPSGRAKDVAVVTVRDIVPQLSLPVLRAGGELAEFAARSAVSAIVQPAALALGERDVKVVVGETIGGKVYEMVRKPMAKAAVSILHTGRKVEGEHVVSTVTARATLTAGDEALHVPGDRFAGPLEDAIKAAKETTYDHVGRLVSVKVSNRTTGARSASVEATFTFHGQVA